MTDRAAAFTARYGAEAPALPPGPWNETIESLLAHKSVRAYRPDPLPPGTLETLVAAAQSAPTSSNMQTWSVVSVTDPAARAVLARIAGNQAHIEQCPLFLVWVADLSRLERMSQRTDKPLEGLPYLETFLVAALDAAIAAQNAIVAAESIGLATVYIGALRNDMATVAELLGLPPGAAGVVGLCVGYEAETATPAAVKPRLSQSVILHHNRYDADKDIEGIALYDRAMQAFSQRAELTRYSWTERMFTRLGRVTSLSGRDKLHAVLVRLGFPLQ